MHKKRELINDQYMTRLGAIRWFDDWKKRYKSWSDTDDIYLNLP